MAPLVENYASAMMVIDLLAEGKTMTDACHTCGIAVMTFRRMLDRNPEIAEMYREAEQIGHDTLADILLNIDSDPTYGSSDPKMATVKSLNIKWYLEKKNKARYGKTAVVEHHVTADIAVIDALNRGKQRAIEGNVIEDVTYTVIEKLPATITVAGVEIDADLADFL